MSVETIQNCELVLRNMNSIMIVLRATGGYKFNKLIKLSDNELREAGLKAEGVILDFAMRVVVAEELLQQDPPHYHKRWSDYQDMLLETKEVVKERAQLQAKQVSKIELKRKVKK